MRPRAPGVPVRQHGCHETGYRRVLGEESLMGLDHTRVRTSAIGIAVDMERRQCRFDFRHRPTMIGQVFRLYAIRSSDTSQLQVGSKHHRDIRDSVSTPR